MMHEYVETLTMKGAFGIPRGFFLSENTALILGGRAKGETSDSRFRTQVSSNVRSEIYQLQLLKNNSYHESDKL